MSGYDYEAAVLWNAHGGALWRRFSIYLRREIAKRAGLTQRAFRDHARISFEKVAEYQKRGAVHFHAVIRLDGPEGGNAKPPAWASAELLTDAIRAATAARVDGPEIEGRAHGLGEEEPEEKEKTSDGETVLTIVGRREPWSDPGLPSCPATTLRRSRKCPLTAGKLTKIITLLQRDHCHGAAFGGIRLRIRQDPASSVLAGGGVS